MAEQMCLACGERPAVPSSKTVPLCAQCAALVTDNRGVRFQKTEEAEQQEGTDTSVTGP